MHLGKEAVPYTNTIRLSFSSDDNRLGVSFVNNDEMSLKVEIWDMISNTAVQKVSINGHDLNQYLGISNSRLNSLSWSDEEEGSWEDEVDEGKDEDHGDDENDENDESDESDESDEDEKNKEDWFRIDKFFFLGESHLILDSIRPDNIRLVLRTKMNVEVADLLNDRLFRSNEASKYDVDSSKSWVTCNGERLIWIPPEYRNGAMDIKRNCVAITQSSGLLCAFQLCHGISSGARTIPDASIAECSSRLPEQEEYDSREVDDDRAIVHLDMQAPDDDMMHEMNAVDKVKERLSITSRKMREKFSDWKEDLSF